MLSVIIPARNEPYLQDTINSILSAAKDRIEIIAVLDGYWPQPIITDDSRVTLIHFSEPKGMRASINAAARIARGDFLLKCDAHCIFDEGFDLKLKEDCQDKWVMVPRRYDLDVKNWKRKNRYYEFEYIRRSDLKGQKWPEYAERVEGQDLCDLMTWQGSCWFMHRKTFFDFDCLDEDNYGGMGKEAQEVCLKTWLSGGRLVLTRRTWYAHWSKPRSHVIPMGKEKKKSTDFAVDFWLGDKWPNRVQNFMWLIDKFAPVPTWEEACIRS